MADEGVIKFDLRYTRVPLRRPVTGMGELNAWRQILFRLGLTGLDPSRYQGFAYGNLSLRIEGRSFIISGTQTAAKPQLSVEDYCRVLDFDLAKNRISAEGPIPPSSEALTHGAIYAGNPEAACVIHVHSPEIWRNARQLGFFVTDPAIAYGTPAMGEAVRASAEGASGVIAMGGHEDGIIAFGLKTEQAAFELLRCLAQALELEQSASAAHQP